MYLIPAITACLIAFGLLPIFNNMWAAGFMVFVIGGFTCGYLAIKAFDINDWMDRTVVALVVVNVASAVYSSNPYYAKQALLFNVAGLCVMVFMKQNQTNLNLIMWFCIIIGSIGSIISHFMLPMTAGFLGNSNYTGHWLAIPTVFCVWFLFKRKWIASVPLALIAYGHYITRCRTAWIAAACGILAVIVWNRADRKAMFVAIAIGLLLSGLALNNLKNTSFVETKTFFYRLKYFAASLQMASESPLFGTGLRSYRNGVYEAQAKLGEKFFEGYEDPKPRHAHNDYLEVINDAGLIGLGLLGYLFIRVLWNGWNARLDTFPILVGMIVVMIGMLCLFWRTLPLHTLTIASFLGAIEGCSRRSLSRS